MGVETVIRLRDGQNGYGARGKEVVTFSQRHMSFSGTSLPERLRQRLEDVLELDAKAQNPTAIASVIDTLEDLYKQDCRRFQGEYSRFAFREEILPRIGFTVHWDTYQGEWVQVVTARNDRGVLPWLPDGTYNMR